MMLELFKRSSDRKEEMDRVSKSVVERLHSRFLRVSVQQNILKYASEYAKFTHTMQCSP